MVHNPEMRLLTGSFAFYIPLETPRAPHQSHCYRNSCSPFRHRIYSLSELDQPSSKPTSPFRHASPQQNRPQRQRVSHPSTVSTPHIDPLYTLKDPQFTENLNQCLTPEPMWRFILLSDGHIVQHLSILTQHPTKLALLETTYCVKTVRRRIAILGPEDVPLLHASSVWDIDAYNSMMAGRETLPLFEVFSQLRLACSREIPAVHYGTCATLEEMFNVSKGTGMWARDFEFRRNGASFLSIHEVFSPSLSKWLGPIVPPKLQG